MNAVVLTVKACYVASTKVCFVVSLFHLFMAEWGVFIVKVFLIFFFIIYIHNKRRDRKYVFRSENVMIMLIPFF